MQPLPPIVIEIPLALSPVAAYQRFTADFADWWPVATHSLSRCAGTRCLLEPVVGGVLEEIAPGGERHAWGRVIRLEQGHLLRISWHPGREAATAQWVEVVFAEAPGGCLMTLTHGGWDALGEIAPLLRQQYIPGWNQVLADGFLPSVGLSEA